MLVSVSQATGVLSGCVDAGISLHYMMFRYVVSLYVSCFV